MEEQGYQEVVALNVQLGPSKLLSAIVHVLIVCLVKALQLHSQHVHLVWLMSTVQIMGIHVLHVWPPVKPQILPLGRQHAVSKCVVQVCESQVFSFFSLKFSCGMSVFRVCCWI